MARAWVKTRYPGIYSETRADGTTVYLATYRVDGRRRTKTFDRLADATAYKGRQTDRARSGDHLDPAAGAVTFAAFAETWIASRPWRDSTRAHARSQLDAHLIPALGPRRLATIRRSDIDRLVASLTASGLAPATVESIARRASAILAAAQRDRLIGHNPADGMRLPTRTITPEQRAAALDPETLAALLDVLPGRLEAYALTMALAGLRPSEAAGLTVDRVDFLGKRVTVDRQLIGHDGAEPIFGPPKTPASVRTVPLADELLTALAAHLAAFGTAPGGLIFRSRTSTPLNRSGRGESWRRASRRLTANAEKARERGEKPTPVLPAAARGWHTLRHSYASALIAAGVPLTTVARMLGHSSISETQSTYAHMIPRSDESARGAAASILLAR